jgi:hypothetical protein
MRLAASNLSLTSQGCRRDTEHPCENTREVALVGKAAFQSDRTNGCVAADKQGPGVADSLH